MKREVSVSDVNRLGELERISLKFLVGCFEVCSPNFIGIVWSCGGERIRLLSCVLNFHTHICSDVTHQVPFQYKSPTSSSALPSEVSCLYQSEPSSTVLCNPSTALSTPAKGLKQWSRAIDPWRWEFTWGQHCLWSGVKAEWVKWDWICPPCCQEPWRSGWPSSFSDPAWSIAPHVHQLNSDSSLHFLIHSLRLLFPWR